MADTKIFIDTDEEITFLVEKIKLSPTPNVVVIVPDRASIFITSASLRLLKKAVDRLDKKVILVTMDESGKKMADSINFTTVYRVRDVTPDIWSNVKKNVPHKSNNIKKNNVIRELPEEFKTSVNESNKISEDNKEIENESVLPNVQQEKFEFPNKEEDILDQNKDDIESNSDLTSEEIEQIKEDEKILDEPSVLESDENEEVNLQKLEELENIEMENDSTPETVIPQIQKFVNHSIKDSESLQINVDEEDEFIFFHGEDISEKDVKKKFQKSKLHLKIK